MKNTSRNINIHGGIDKQDPNVSIPDTWAENSNRNIQDSQGNLNKLMHCCCVKILKLQFKQYKMGCYIMQ